VLRLALRPRETAFHAIAAREGIVKFTISSQFLHRLLAERA
jgi:hypothetical protein